MAGVPLPIENDCARGCLEQASENPQQCGLTGARPPDDPDDLACADVERDVMQDRSLSVRPKQQDVDAVDLVQDPAHDPCHTSVFDVGIGLRGADGFRDGDVRAPSRQA